MTKDIQVNDFDFLNGPSDKAARRLLGSLLISEQSDGRKLVSRIVETEAYDQSDAASHSYKGSTPRTEVMFGPSGHLYVYFTYGMHYCCNVVTGPEGYGSAVLIRALEPVRGQQQMALRRGGKFTAADPGLTNGPAKLCQAYGINMSYNGHDLQLPPLHLKLQDSLDDADIVTTTRIGISRAREEPWRYYIRGNAYISKL